MNPTVKYKKLDPRAQVLPTLPPARRRLTCALCWMSR